MTLRQLQVAVPVAQQAASVPLGGVPSSQSAPTTQQNRGLLRRIFGKGCRTITFIAGAVLIVACFLAVLAVQWTVTHREAFNTATPVPTVEVTAIPTDAVSTPEPTSLKEGKEPFASGIATGSPALRTSNVLSGRLQPTHRW